MLYIRTIYGGQASSQANETTKFMRGIQAAIFTQPRELLLSNQG